MDPANPTNLASHYECPVCFEYARPPIFQCQNGHLVCSNCSPKLECCPTCKGQLGVSRNLLMERMLDTIIFPCKYSSTGCQVTMLRAEMSAHEDEQCSFRPRPCIFCPFQGTVEKVLTHTRQKHFALLVQGNYCTYSVTNAALYFPSSDKTIFKRSKKLLICFGHQFMFYLLRIKNANDQFDFIVIAHLLNGSLDEASKFNYKVKLRGRYHQKIWESTPLIRPDNGILAALASTLTIEKYGSRVFDSTTSHLFLVNDEITFDFEIVQSTVFAAN